MQCMYSEANPSPTCNFTLYMVGSNTVSSVSGCSISYDLDQSSLVSCTAGNIAVSRSSNNQTITVVPAQRILHFNVDGANVTDNNVTSYPGENVTFSCNIDFSDELKTLFYFFHESNNIGSEQSFDLTLQPSDTGNYSCTSMDSFGNYSASIYLVVLFLHNVGCHVQFYTNSVNLYSASRFTKNVVIHFLSSIACTEIEAQQPYTQSRISFVSFLLQSYVLLTDISESIANKIETSKDVIKASESNYLLRSDQQLTMNCTPSDANPPATCSWQLCSDSRCQTLTSDGGCLISVGLNTSSTVTCTASNRAGNISSAEQTVDVVPVERQVHFNLSGSNITNDGSINSTTYLGESIMISCSVPYENELSTTYTLKLPNNSAVAQSSIQFPSVSRFDTGGYDCHTNDQFGTFSAAIYLNVIYAATQDEIPTCNWNLNETEICSVLFFSNPNSQFVSLSKDEQTVASDDSMTITPTGDQGEQTFTFNRKSVENSDVGRYNLTVKSSSSSLFSNSVLYFDIVIVIDIGLSTGAIAGIIAGVVVVILCGTGYGVYKWRSGPQKKDGSQSNEMYPTGSGNRTLTDQPGYIEVTANDSTQISSDHQRNYEVVGPAEDENGYLAVNGSTTGHLRNRASNSQLETDNAGYIVLNGEESNAQSNNQGNESSSSKRYENIEGAYDDVIIAPRAHTENGSRRYENVEGPYDEINNS
ncbi:uncharacterized protein LOC143444999 [Clavelina lepadiformis]|uniref:uncharacterized protein LOC143444999 n=1 Tax=Clavelina lepadiformis TaxID=159417 RepID=UPI0040414370